MRYEKLKLAAMLPVVFGLSLICSCAHNPATPQNNARSGCRVMDVGAAVFEKPSFELMLDRLNTSGAALRLVNVVLKDMAISDTADWPQKLNDYTFGEMARLGMDGMYASHGGQVPCAKKHVISVQELLYRLPPDNYAQPGDFYCPGEATIINGKYYKIHSVKNIIEKCDPTPDEIREGVASIMRSMGPRNRRGIIEKKLGILRGNQVSGNRYPSLIDAVCSLSPNGKAIADAFESRDRVKAQYAELAEELRELGKKKRENKCKEDGEQMNILKEQLEKCAKALGEKNHILTQELDQIDTHEGTVDDPADVRVLLNVSNACQGTSGLLWDAISLITVAVGKLTQSAFSGFDLPGELKRISHPQLAQANGPQSKVLSQLFALGSKKKKEEPKIHPPPSLEVWIPLRVARLKANAFNALGTLAAIKTMLTQDRVLVNKIREKADLLINPDVAAEIQSTPQATQTKTLVHDSPPSTAATPKSCMYKKIQKGLTVLGYQPGPVDGKPGAKTRTAIANFQQDFGFPKTGRPDNGTFRIIKYACTLHTSGVDVKSDPGQVSGFFKNVQSSLKKLGLYTGAIDGMPGKGTCRAVKKFQSKEGSPETDGVSGQDREQISQMIRLCL